MKKLKLYVWENVLYDYTYGIMFALAESVEEARKLLLQKCDYLDEEDINKDPREIVESEAFIVWGGA